VICGKRNLAAGNVTVGVAIIVKAHRFAMLAGQYGASRRKQNAASEGYDQSRLCGRNAARSAVHHLAISGIDGWVRMRAGHVCGHGVNKQKNLNKRLDRETLGIYNGVIGKGAESSRETKEN